MSVMLVVVREECVVVANPTGCTVNSCFLDGSDVEMTVGELLAQWHRRGVVGSVRGWRKACSSEG